MNEGAVVVAAAIRRDVVPGELSDLGVFRCGALRSEHLEAD
jgi:hypothetical protein